MADHAKLIGEKELYKKLNNLEAKVRRKSLRKATSKAIRPAVKSQKADVRPISKTVAKAIGVRTKYYKHTQTFVALAGVRNIGSVVAERPHTQPFTGNVSMRKHDPRHTAHLIEGGTKPHDIGMYKKKHFFTVHHPGTKANPFVEESYKKNERAIQGTFNTVLRDEVAAAVR